MNDENIMEGPRVERTILWNRTVSHGRKGYCCCEDRLLEDVRPPIPLGESSHSKIPPIIWLAVWRYYSNRLFGA